ncbi:MAG: LemA family protein [Candidatus Nanoarchaeia archaeon]|nr:LemA family protein [Candidatus Nanoarchaeia archaeon]
MKMEIKILLIIIGVVFLGIISMFNSLIRLKNHVKNSWSGIDVQLKRRNDLIPNLVNVVKGYATHEKETLENIVKLRNLSMNQTNLKDIAKTQDQLSSSLKSLFAVSENYPNLKANQNFMELQSELSKTENQIAASRRIYNENVTYFNNKIETFPSNIIAKMFSFKQADFFEATKEEKKEVNISF